MTLLKIGGWFLLGLVLAFKSLAQTNADEPFFIYDVPDEKVHATVLENPLFYDAGVASRKEGLWLAWLEFVPGKGDLLWVGLRGKEGWLKKIQVQSQPGDLANPTPVFDANGHLWLSYEAGKDGSWDIFVQQLYLDGSLSSAQRLSSGNGANINHRVKADSAGGLWFVWQGDNNGQFDIFARRFSRSQLSEFYLVSGSTSGDWQPSLTVATNGNMNVVWDGYDGKTYQVFGRSYNGNVWGKIAQTTGGGAFQGHAQIASAGNGPVWLLWEEDGENWGKVYRARTPGDTQSTKLSDKIGPLHRFRKLQLDEFGTNAMRQIEVPMPSLKLAANRTNAPADVKYTGAFYEDGQLTVDGKGRLWLTYRHFYTPWIGIVPEHHKQDSWMLYSRCLLKDGWSKLYSFDVGQGDGMQRLTVVPEIDGISVVWNSGRTDRRKTDKPRGVAFAQIHLDDNAKSVLPITAINEKRNFPETSSNAFGAHTRPTTELAARHFELFFGDLHRHTDISLCFAPSDGSIDDAYRYAIDAAPLDFLGITDHTHDLAMGDELSLIWWRSRKEVNRHQLRNTFIPFFAYERSRTDTDHNVISLRDDMLRPHTYPLTQFWTELDTNTFTIAHQPFNRILWNYKDDVHRPLVEIYQGFRNDAKEKDAKEGLLRGHKFGIIASSDHLSTDASFACVWAENTDREGVFRAMQARRTYGATAKIQLKVFAGEHWMGESFSTNAMPPIQIEAVGTAPFSRCDILIDGDVKKTITGSHTEEKFTYQADASLTGPHIFYVRLEQSDGNQAWSSPLWVDIKP